MRKIKIILICAACLFFVTSTVTAQKRKATKVIEGTISRYECADNCYLIITDKKGKEHTGLCRATFCNASWAWKTMPARYKGKRVRVTVGKGTQYDGAGNVMGKMDAFIKIKFLKRIRK